MSEVTGQDIQRLMQRNDALVERVRLLERKDPGKGTDGSVLTADSTQPGLVAWKKQPSRLTSGYVADVAGGASTAVFLTITVTGDGVTPVRVKAHIPTIYSSAVSQVDVGIFDGVTQLQKAFVNTTVINTGSFAAPEIVVAAFSGSKTFNVKLSASAGTPGWVAQPTYPAWLEATWAP